MGATMGAATVCLVFLFLLLFVVLAVKNIRADGAGYESSNCPERTSAELVPNKSSASSTEKSRS